MNEYNTVIHSQSSETHVTHGAHREEQMAKKSELTGSNI